MKLPGIIYSTPTEPLGRYGSRAPQIVERTGKVEGAAIADAGRILGRSITEAGTAVARGRYEAEVRKNEIIKRDIIARSRLDIQSSAAMKTAVLNVATDLAQTYLRYSAQMKDAEQAADVTRRSTDLHTAAETTLQELKASPRIDINRYAKYGIEVQEGDDEYILNEDGSMSRMVDTDKYSGQILEAVMREAKAGIFDGLEGSHRADLENKIAAIDGAAIVDLGATNISHQMGRLRSQMQADVARLMDMGKVDEAVEVAAVAESRGLEQPGYARQIKSEATSRSDFKNYMAAIDAARTQSALDAIKEEVKNNNAIDETRASQLRNQASQKEKELQAAENNIIFQGVTDEVFIDQDITDKSERELLQDVQDKFEQAGMEPDSIRSEMVKARAKLKNIKAGDAVYRNNLFDNIEAEIDAAPDFQYPNISIPPDTFTAKQERELIKKMEAKADGREVLTNLPIYYELKDMAFGSAEEQRKFASTFDHRDYVGTIGKTDMSELMALQANILDGTVSSGDGATESYINGEIKTYVEIFFDDRESKWTADEKENAMDIRHTAKLLVEAEEQRLGRKPTSTEVDTVLNDFFRKQIFSEMRPTDRDPGAMKKFERIPASGVDENIWVIEKNLRAIGKPTNLENILWMHNKLIRDTYQKAQGVKRQRLDLYERQQDRP